MKKETVFSLDVFVEKKCVSAFYKAIKICNQNFKFVSDCKGTSYLFYNVYISGSAQDAYWFGSVFTHYTDAKIRKNSLHD